MVTVVVCNDPECGYISRFDPAIANRMVYCDWCGECAHTEERDDSIMRRIEKQEREDEQEDRDAGLL